MGTHCGGDTCSTLSHARLVVSKAICYCCHQGKPQTAAPVGPRENTASPCPSHLGRCSGRSSIPLATPEKTFPLVMRKKTPPCDCCFQWHTSVPKQAEPAHPEAVHQTTLAPHQRWFWQEKGSKFTFSPCSGSPTPPTVIRAVIFMCLPASPGPPKHWKAPLLFQLANTTQKKRRTFKKRLKIRQSPRVPCSFCSMIQGLSSHTTSSVPLHSFSHWLLEGGF